MNAPARKEKKPEYPQETEGTRSGYKARRLASKMTAEQREKFLQEAMAIVYGAKSKETVGAGR